MKRVRLLPLMLLLAVAMPGCAGFNNLFAKRAPNDTPLSNDCRLTYITALRELTIARQAGLISDSDKAQIETVRVKVVASLDALEQAELAGDKSLLDQNKAQLSTWLDQLTAWSAKVKKKPSAMILLQPVQYARAA